MKKLLVSSVILIAVICSACLCACKSDSEVSETDEHTHIWVLDTSKSGTPTCGEGATLYYYCSVEGCTETMSAYLPATGEHDFGDDEICDVCGYIDMSDVEADEGIEKYGFYFEDADGSNTYTAGDKVLFGSYPQELVEDDNVLSVLEDEAGELPTAYGTGDGWISYGYYDAGETADYMFYKDVEVNGVKYRGVYLLNYRPYYSNLAAGEDYSYIDDSGFNLDTVYWFVYSPISWTVLSYGNGDLFLMASRCLEGQPFQALYETDSEGNLVIAGTDTYVNDWEASTLRAFLNEDFYNTAFSLAEQDMVDEVTLDNKTSGFSTTSAYQIIQNDTEDKVFLISCQDILNESYGLTGNLTRSFTSYATIQGMRPSTEGTTSDGEPSCYYILRSAGRESYIVCGVSKQGTLGYSGNNIKVNGTDSYDGYAVNGDLGVLPALYIKVGK